MRSTVLILMIMVASLMAGCAKVVTCQCPVGEPIAFVLENGRTRVICGVPEKGIKAVVYIDDTRVLSEMYLLSSPANMVSMPVK